jgi:uncharacterized protein (TIGR02145 family)
MKLRAWLEQGRGQLLASVLAAGMVCWLFGCGGDDGEGGSVNNPGNNGGNNGGGNADYVTLGGKKWMKKNLNVQTADSWCYGEGGEVYDYGSESWKTLTSSEIQANCNKYGRLYTWEAAKTACPSGWRLPSGADWDALVEAAGGSSIAGSKLKSKSGWYSDGNGTDAYGFSALPGGSRSTDGYFGIAGYSGHWWAATEVGSGSAYSRYMYYDYDYVFEGTSSKEVGFAVRCVRD